MNKRISPTIFILCILYPFICTAQNSPEQEAIISVERIWDRAGHNAFTGLVEFNNKLYCSFREGEKHVHGINGSVRVIASDDGQNWYSVAHLFRKDVDLRDPKLSVTPDQRLMINIGGSVYVNEQLESMEPLVSFSDHEGKNFSNAQKIIIDERIRSDRDWLWRASWHEGIAYATVYQSRGNESVLQLVRSRDGRNYEYITTFELAGKPNETTLRFTSDGQMVAIVRRESQSTKGFIGTSSPPYTNWTWQELEARLGGPDLLILPDGGMIAGTRAYPQDQKNRMILAKVTLNGNFRKLVTLPSGGDCSYPALIIKDNILYVSYYSSHEEKTSIYLARLWLDRIQTWIAMEEADPPFVQSDQNGLVVLACPDTQAEIRYTLDGSEPAQTNGTVYRAPIKVESTIPLNMRSFRSGKFPSKPVTAWIGKDVFVEAAQIDQALDPGLRYTYYEGELRSVTDIKNLRISDSGITPRINTDIRKQEDYFAIQFDGYLSVPADGIYYFYLLSNDGSRLIMDNEVMLDNDGSHAENETSLAVSLRKGKHHLRLTYFQLGGAHTLKLFWKGPGFDKKEVAENLLFH